MQLATSQAWSRQDALAAAAEQALLQAACSAEAGMASGTLCASCHLHKLHMQELVILIKTG